MSGSIHDAVLRAAALRSARAAHDRQVKAQAEALRAARRLRRRRIVESCCLVGLALAGVVILVLGGAS